MDLKVQNVDLKTSDEFCWFWVCSFNDPCLEVSHIIIDGAHYVRGDFELA